MMLIGLTGGIAAGKSAVSSFLKEQHIAVIDTDEIARRLTQPGNAGEEALKRVFPARFFPQNTLDRQKLARYCFSSLARTDKLNRTLHPLIQDEVTRRLAQMQEEPFVVLDVPLLFEAGWDKLCDRVIVVECDRETRIARAMARDGLTRREVEARMARQASDETRRRGADYRIDNSGTEQETRAQVGDLIRILKKEGAKPE
ncbi:MAG: dephospho-CoA kinase [Clostridia bacterium]|nr:dephospho-CoA kinase [Clostridia bacterium]